MDMAFRARSTAFTVPEGGEGATHGSSRVDMYMRIAAIIVGALAAKKMDTGWYAMGIWVMRQVTSTSCLACTCLKEILADSDLMGIVGKQAIRSMGAIT